MMLAQGQASSAKRGGLAVVSSGLIFLKKKKKLSLERFSEALSAFHSRKFTGLRVRRKDREIRLCPSEMQKL